MKKNYLSPHVAVYHIEPSKLIAESLGLDNTQTLGEGEILSKDSGDWDVWDDDDE